MLKTVRLFALAACVLACAGAVPPRAEYTFTPILESGALRAVQVDLRFRGEADGVTGLRLPEAWGGQQELWRGIAALEAREGAALEDGEGPARRVLRHEPNARIHVRYRVVQDWEGEPTASQSNPYRPIMQPSYFHLIGSTALIVPEIEGATIARVRVRGLPRGWSFASDLQHGPLALAELEASVTVGGDYRILRAEAQGLRVAMRGSWSFADEAFTRQVADIIGAQRAFWGDRPAPFLVTVTQLSAPDPGWTSIGGTGLGDAFAFFATPNAPADPLTRTLAHEGLHTWIPGQIGGAPEVDEAQQYWFSEGFTDFYTGRVLIRAGFWTPRQFADDLNEMLSAYARSPERTAPNARIAADFWSGREIHDLPYQRGRLLATIWDARLRAAGARDLDDVLFEMRRRAQAGDPLKAGALFPVAAAALGLEVGAELSAHVERGAPILLPEHVFSPCGAVTTRQAREFHRGFDVEATVEYNGVIVGVVRDGPAYGAGMRDGMVLVRREAGEIGDAEQEIAYVVRDGPIERTLRYLPRGRGSFTVQRLVLAEALEGESLARCVAALGGA